MGKVLTAEELREMREDGDELEIHDGGRRVIEGFSELVEELRALVEAQRANAGADMLRSEAQSELIAVLRKLVGKPAGSIDMAPLTELLAEMMEMKGNHHQTYQFNIERDNRGFMTSVVATPAIQTRH